MELRDSGMNAKLEIKRPLTSSSRLKKILFSYLAIGSLVLALTLSGATILPLYSRLKAAEDRNIQHAVETRAMAISEWARRSKDLAWQITSRTRIRQELKKYNNGEISLDQVKSFTEPKLVDAMNLSKEILGIMRLDNKEQLVAKCGLNVPKEKWPLSDTTLKNITASQPSITSDYFVFIVRAPILSRDGAYEGADLIVIDLSNLKEITSNYSGLGKTSQIILGCSSCDNSINPVFPLKSQNLDVDNGQTFNSTVATLLKKGINGEKGLEKIDKKVFAYTPLFDFSWVILISQSENELYASLNNKLLIIGSSTIFIYLVFILGFWLIMNPLSGRLLIHAEELEESIIEKTQYLNDEILIRKKAEEKLIILSTTDELTDTNNRRAFNDFLRKNIGRALRYKENLSLLLLDIDLFKNVNDTFGHDVGDRVLKELVKVAKESIRQEDILGRWGGEEFIILLPQTGGDNALQLAERLREKISEHSFPTVGQVTVSIGLSEFGPEDTSDSVVKRVDIALYAAKEAGRNIVKTN